MGEKKLRKCIVAGSDMITASGCGPHSSLPESWPRPRCRAAPRSPTQLPSPRQSTAHCPPSALGRTAQIWTVRRLPTACAILKPRQQERHDDRQVVRHSTSRVCLALLLTVYSCRVSPWGLESFWKAAACLFAKTPITHSLGRPRSPSFPPPHRLNCPALSLHVQALYTNLGPWSAGNNRTDCWSASSKAVCEGLLGYRLEVRK